MLRKLYFFLPKLFYSFPVQLLFNHFRRNQMMVLCWIILFAMISGNFGKYIGIPYLFLDPEYLNQVDFRSFFIMGVLTAGFTSAFNITSYINDGHRFSFVGTLAKPFSKYSLNNSILPLAFLFTYIYQIIGFQINNEFSTGWSLALDLLGLFTGYVSLTLVLFIYFILTQKDIFKYMVCRLDEKLKKTVRITRASAMRKLEVARKKQIRVDYYLNFKLKFKRVDEKSFYDKATIVQVFDQNHFNLVIIELLILAFVIILGIFKDSPVFQLPAAASCMIFLTICVMLTGAFTYWFGSWSGTAGLVLFLFFNHLVGQDFFSREYKAFGLDYAAPAADYSIETMKLLGSAEVFNNDKAVTSQQLVNWRSKFGEKKPKMIFLCVSGGGKRAALWTLNSLQTADSQTQGKLMEHSILITGASGGLIGASYFRELKLRDMNGEDVKPYDGLHREKISTDNLNPLIFSLLANDLFVGFTSYEYAGQLYQRDRAYTFEDQLNQITEGFMDKPISAYFNDELQAKIPMIILTPTVVNDGRKLYIASRPVSFMNMEAANLPKYADIKYAGVDFNRMFVNHGAKDLRFLSALRMSATFPYITPNTTLPTEPPIQIMDAGISDNFGLSDAVRFLYAFKEWIAQNTSGVIFLSIRDSPKLSKVMPKAGQTIVDEMTQPISSIYNNFENLQDITSDLLIGHALSWFGNDIDRIDIQYQAENYVPMLQKMDSIRQNSARASLSWRLTTREKQGIINSIRSERNQEELTKLVDLLNQ